MKINIHNREYEFLEVEARSPMLVYGDVIGTCDHHNFRIVINKDLNVQLKKETLIHELTHAFLKTYDIQYDNDTYDEEQVCNFLSKYAADILEIANKIY